MDAVGKGMIEIEFFFVGSFNQPTPLEKICANVKLDHHLPKNWDENWKIEENHHLVER